MTLHYNLMMAVTDAAVLAYLGRRKNGRAWLAGLVCGGMIALGLAVAGGEDHFGVYRLAAYGVFLHGVVVLAGSAVLLRRRRRVVAAGSAATAAILLLIAADAFLIEPSWLEVTHRRIASEKIEQPIRIVVLADLQTDRIGAYERGVFRRVLQEKPDVILLAGDYLQAPPQRRPALRDELNGLLGEIGLCDSAKVFAVQGNVDRRYDWADIFRGLKVITVWHTRSFELDGLRLTCLGLLDSYNPTLEIAHEEPQRFHVVLGHVPNFALGRIEADLLVAGHTHGGQVRLPPFGPLTTHSVIPNRWADGLTDLPGGGQLLVSRGVGMERKFAPRLRFLCRPELAVIDLVPKGE